MEEVTPITIRGNSMDGYIIPQGSRLCQEAPGQILNIILTHLGNRTGTEYIPGNRYTR